MNRLTHFVIFVVLSVLLCAPSARAQESEQEEHGKAQKHESEQETRAEEAEHEEHGVSDGHGGRPHHLNDVAIFLGGTDEHGHPTEFTWGLDYKRRVAERWAVGGLFDYAGGLRNAIVAASVTWFPIGNLTLTAAPGIEFHRGRGSSEDCNCPHALTSDDGGGTGEVDENATYFIFRVGVGWGIPIGNSYAIEPQVNLDLVEGEKVWVYGLNFIYAW
jgi:hypothetical protein